ncbi:pyridoxal phosphate-dependent aminotransferase [Mucilaginibacter agri]|uniref:Aminotransferase class I/II-fold pyridoxal phosphate-dependent enzyme n=1 Tax=Mucilaginibacter agri TaxID=2695265 RepID=A0A965ZLH5_9SPHI|nr:histidinol-phosphate transaminase [Mucilaginibacter agri]NCD72134.1 aminotransferase class I/II-fold pyridoxal phosphate-dependent enzyme [Mucilaginibacter agri]
MATINRRNWIRSSALMAAGITVFSGSVSKLVAMPAKLMSGSFDDMAVTDESVITSASMAIKARLSANENPFGPSPAAKKAIQDALDLSYQYPFMRFSDLTGKIAAYEGIDQKNILMDAGSTPLLHAAAQYYGKNGAEIICGDPSYDDLPRSAAKLGSKLVKVPLTPDYKLDLDAMEAKIGPNTGLIYICNPNNPTATVLDTAKLKAFCERVSKKVTVFIDEAYIDYLPDPQGTTLISGVKAGQNIIVARTFSKLYGFAGLRCGYVVAQPETVKTLSDYATGIMSLSATTVAAAIAGYQEKEFLQAALKKTMESKEYLYSVLKKEGYNYIPSSTNFVMFEIKMDGARFANEMANRGVSIRHWEFNNKNWCRVSIGRMDEMQAFADAFKQLS